MDNTILIQVTNEKARKILHELEELNLIKVVKENLPPGKVKLSDKYKNVFSMEMYSLWKMQKNFDEHTQIMREEWNNT